MSDSVRSKIDGSKDVIPRNVKFSRGGVLLGRQSGKGNGQEIVLGDGFTITNGILSFEGGAAWEGITGKPTSFPTNTADIADASSVPIPIIVDDEVDGFEEVAVKYTEGGELVANGFAVRINETNWVSIESSPSPLSMQYGNRAWRINLFATDANRQHDLPDASGTFALTTRADGKVSYSDLVDVPTAVPLTASKVVANSAARLALSLEDAVGYAVVEADTGKSFMLVEGSLDPSDNADWTQIGDRDIQQSDVPGLVSELAGKVSITDLSTTGGPNKVPQFSGTGDIRFAPINGSSGYTPPPIRIAARQRLAFENYSGVPGYGEIYLFPDHSPSGLGSSHHEMIYASGRHCFYWDDGFQMGNADNNRGNRFVYMRHLGLPTAGDPIRESVPVWFDGQVYNGGTPVMSKIGIQWVPSGDHSGEFVFGISGSSYIDGGSNNKMKSLSGVILPFSITEAGPKVGTGKVLTFGDGTTMATAPNLQARTGNITLVGGTKTVADASVTNKTNVLLTRRVSGGTVGEITYQTTPGVGFTVNSSSGTDSSRLTYLLVEDTLAANAPSISGTNAVGDTLTVISGGGSGTYQWYSNGVAVSGQTASTYVIRHQDIGLPVTCREDGVASNAITAWHPDDESGYFADYRADVGVLKTGGSAAAHGEAVETWQDQSGNARHLTQATGTRQPILDTSGTGGRPAFIDFDATDDYLSRTIAVPRPYSVFIVAEADTVIANRRYFSTASSGSRMIISQDTSTTARYTNGTNNLDATGQVNLDERHILFGKTSSSVNEFKVDSNTTLSDANGTSANGSEIIVSQSSSGGGADVKVYALLIYTADLDASAQARVRAYLKAKWGTP